MTVGTKAVAVGKALLIMGDTNERYSGGTEKHILVVPNLPNEVGKKKNEVFISFRYYDPADHSRSGNKWRSFEGIGLNRGLPISVSEWDKIPDFRFETEYLLENGRPRGGQLKTHNIKAVDVKDLEEEAEKVEALSRQLTANLLKMSTTGKYEFPEGESEWSASTILSSSLEQSLTNISTHSVEITDKDMSDIGVYHKMPPALATRLQNVYTEYALTK